MILKGEGGGGVSISSLKYTGKPLFATACASQYKKISFLLFSWEMPL